MMSTFGIFAVFFGVALNILAMFMVIGLVPAALVLVGIVLTMIGWALI